MATRKPRKPEPRFTASLRDGAAEGKPPSASTPAALRYGVKLLARREYARSELRQRLIARGHDAASADQALAQLAARRHQSDARYAEMLARTRASQGYGPRRILGELSVRGIVREQAQSALEGLDRDWLQIARELVRRRCGVLRDAASRMRAAQLLLRRGFDAATVRCVTRTEVEEAADADGD